MQTNPRIILPPEVTMNSDQKMGNSENSKWRTRAVATRSRTPHKSSQGSASILDNRWNHRLGFLERWFDKETHDKTSLILLTCRPWPFINVQSGSLDSTRPEPGSAQTSARRHRDHLIDSNYDSYTWLRHTGDLNHIKGSKLDMLATTSSKRKGKSPNYSPQGWHMSRLPS
jgi:hypothetical protein